MGASRYARTGKARKEVDDMLTRIAIQNFRSLRSIELGLGELNVLVGANASGKTNFIDAIIKNPKLSTNSIKTT